MSTTECTGGDCHNGESNLPTESRLSYESIIAQVLPLLYTWISPSELVIRFGSVLMLRIGFLLIQVGNIPITDVNLILLHNIVDLCWVSLTYFLVGSTIAFSGDISGIIGGGYWIGDSRSDKNAIMKGWQAIAIASAISTTCVAGRLHAAGSIVVGTVAFGILQPFFLHWHWTDRGWMREYQLYNITVNFRDHGGAALVHLVGGITGLVGILVLGRRLIRYRDIDKSSIGPPSGIHSTSGHICIIMGLQTLQIAHLNIFQSDDKMKDDKQSIENLDIANILVLAMEINGISMNTILTVAASAMIVVGLHFLRRELFNHWSIMRCLQSLTVGVVIASAGGDAQTPHISIILGGIGGFIFYFLSKIVFISALEDYCNIVVTHVVGALFGSIMAPLLHTIGTHDAKTVMIHVTWQFICLFAIISTTVLATAPIYLLLKCMGLLRNRPEYVNHLRSTAVLQQRPTRSFMRRLFNMNDRTVIIKPGLSNRDIEDPQESHFNEYNIGVSQLPQQQSPIHLTTVKSSNQS